MILRRAFLFWHTVRHLRARQIGARIALRTRAALLRAFPEHGRRHYSRLAARRDLRAPSGSWPAAAANPQSLCTADRWNAARHCSDAVRQGTFTFLNTTVPLGRPVSWEAAGQSQLWRYQLHYLGGLLDLAATGPDSATIAAVLADWISACPMAAVADSWHPFVVSERLTNSLLAIQLGTQSRGVVPDTTWRSLAQQTVFLERNLEWDVGGNHLLKNLKALVVAGCVWNGGTADRWRNRYIQMFDRELARQLLSDGAHYERSPMYHCLVLADAIEVVFSLRLSGHQVPQSLAESLRRMAAYLPTVTHSDEDIALFNDSVTGEAPMPRELAAAVDVALGATPRGPLSVRHALLAASAAASPCVLAPSASAPRTSEDGGLVRIPALAGRGVLIADVGPACPDDLPAHAHADFFSFEVSVDGRRVIVDSGVGEYRAGDWREYYRSSRAHNTLTIDGTDQIECWGSFRVARRAQVVERRAVTGSGAIGVHACHDGYHRLSDPVTVCRTIVAIADRAWIVQDRFAARDPHDWESFLHVEPAMELSIATPSAALISNGSQRLTVAWFGATGATTVRGQMTPRQGWYAPEFGRHLPSSVLALSGRAASGTSGYVLAPDLLPQDVAIEIVPRGLVVRLGRAEHVVDLTTTETRLSGTTH